MCLCFCVFSILQIFLKSFLKLTSDSVFFNEIELPEQGSKQKQTITITIKTEMLQFLCTWPQENQTHIKKFSERCLLLIEVH